MKKIHLLGISFAFMAYLVSIPANAITSYSITFYERIGFSNSNLFTDHIISGRATFAINDPAVSPNNLVLFTDSDFLAFDAIMTTTIGDGQFTLGLDDFPPTEIGPIRARREQGILFDALAQPLRFDTPLSSVSNAEDICDPSCSETTRDRAELTFWDEDDFDTVFLNDGTITNLATATRNGEAFTPLNGRWIFNPLNEAVTQTRSNSYYLISAIPTPPAIWLFGSGLFGLFGLARRKAYI